MTLLLCLLLTLGLSLSVFAADGEAVAVETGPGNDTVTVLLNEAADVTVDTGSGDDSVSVEADGTLSADEPTEIPQEAVGTTPEGSASAAGQTAVNPEVTEENAEGSTKYANAIQQAIRKALQNLSAQDKSATVTVAAGTYYGDINISVADVKSGVTLDDDFELIIRTEDAVDGETGALTAEGEGKAKIEGQVLIDRINVTLAGLYYCVNSLITAQNSRVGVYGTKGDDHVNLVLDSASSAEVHTGEGADAVTVSYGECDPGSSTGSDNSTLSVNTGSGKGRVSVNTKQRKFSSIDVKGADVTLSGSMNAKDITVTAEDLEGAKGYGSEKYVVVNSNVLITPETSVTADNALTVIARNVLSATGAVTTEALSVTARVAVQGSLKAKTVSLLSSNDISSVNAMGARSVSIIRNDSSVKLSSNASVEGESVKLDANAKLQTPGSEVQIVESDVAAETEQALVKATDKLEISATSETDVSTKAGEKQEGKSDLPAHLSDLEAEYAKLGTAQGEELVRELQKLESTLHDAAADMRVDENGKTTVKYVSADVCADISNSTITAANLYVKSGKTLKAVTTGEMDDEDVPSGRSFTFVLGENRAEISGNSTLSVSGKLEVKADSDVNANTVGGGFSFSMDETETYARIGDGVTVNADGSALASLDITNRSKLDVRSNSNAYQAMLSSGHTAQAYLGSGNLINVTGDVNVLNDTDLYRELNTDCFVVDAGFSESATEVRTGKSGTVSTVSDKLSAKSQRKLKAGGRVKVHSTSNNRATHTAKAGSKSQSLVLQSDSHDGDSPATYTLLSNLEKVMKTLVSAQRAREVYTINSGRIQEETPEQALCSYGAEAASFYIIENVAELGGSAEAQEVDVQAVMLSHETKEKDSVADAPCRFVTKAEYAVTDQGILYQDIGCYNAIALLQLSYRNEALIAKDAEIKADALTVRASTDMEVLADCTPGNGNDHIDKAPNIARILLRGDTNALIDSAKVEAEQITLRAEVSEKDSATCTVTKEEQSGFSFSFTDTAANVKAAVDGSAVVQCENLTLQALSDHPVVTVSKAAGNVDNDFYSFYDVSDAVTFISDVITAFVGEDARLTVSGGNDLSTREGDAALEILAESKGNTYTSCDRFNCGEGNPFEDVFFTDSAEGATAAIAITNSKVIAELNGHVEVPNGRTVVCAFSDHNDDVDAKIAINGTMDYAVKITEEEKDGKKLDKYELVALGNLLSVHTFEVNPAVSNETAACINEWLNRFKSSEVRSADDEKWHANLYLPLSMNILLTQDARTERFDDSSPELKELLDGMMKEVLGGAEDSDFFQELCETLGLSDDGEVSFTEDIVQMIVGEYVGNQILYAAVTGTLISAREVYARIGGEVSGKGFTVRAENINDFYASADGMDMQYGSWQDVGRAVGLVCNQNVSRAEILPGTHLTDNGNGVDVKATLIQNMDESYRKNFTAYALAGHMNSIKTVLQNIMASNPLSGLVVWFCGTSLAIASNHSDCAAIVGANAVVKSNGAVNVTSRDQTRLAVKGGDVSDTLTLMYLAAGLGFSYITADTLLLSTGSGGGHAVIHGGCTVRAQVEDGAEITAKSFTLNAIKDSVTEPEGERVDEEGNYHSEYHSDKVLTRNATDRSKTSYINIRTEDDPDIEIKELGFFDVDRDGLDKNLKNASYYLEALAGAVGNNGEDYMEGGAMAALVLHNRIYATIGDNVKITTTGGGMGVKAYSQADARLIGGSFEDQMISLGSGRSGAMADNAEKVWASVGKGCTLTSAGSYTQEARSNYDTALICSAQLPFVGQLGATFEWPPFVLLKAADPSGINLVFTETYCEIAKDAQSEAERTVITAEGDVTVSARSHQLSDIYLRSEAVNLSVSAVLDLLKSANVSGTCSAMFVNKARVTTEIGPYAKVESTGGKLSVTARGSDNSTIYSTGFTFGVSVSSGEIPVIARRGRQGGTALLTSFSASRTDVVVGKAAELSADKDMLVLADVDSIVNCVTKGMALGTKSSSFGIILAWLERHVGTLIDNDARLTAGGSITVDAIGREYGMAFGQAMAFAANIGETGGSSMALTIGAMISKSELTNTVRSGARLSAGNSVNVDTELQSENNIFAGGLNASLTGAIGVAADLAIYINTLSTVVEEGAVLVGSGKEVYNYNNSTNRSERRRGVYVKTIGHEKALQVAIGVGAASTGTVINAVADVIVIKNKVKTEVNGKAVAGYASDAEDAALTGEGSELSMEAEDVAEQDNFAGGLGVGLAKGPKSATVLCLVYMKDVEALTGSNAFIRSAGDATLKAKAVDDLWLLTVAISIGATGTTIGGDVNAVIFKATATAAAGGRYDALGSINVKAQSDSDFTIVGAGAAASGTNGVCAVIVFTYFTAQTKAYIRENAILKAGKDLVVEALSNEYTTPDCAGLGVGGTGGVAGTVDIVITKVLTQAYVEQNAQLTAGGDVRIHAKDNYELLAVVAGVGAGGTAGISVSVLVTIATNDVGAWISTLCKVVSDGSVSVKADSYRKAESYVAGVGGGGTAGVAPAVNVIVAGSKLPQDAVDGMNAGNVDYQANLDWALSICPDDSVKEYSESFATDIRSDGESVKDLEPEGGWDKYGQGHDAGEFTGDVADFDSDHADGDSSDQLGDKDGDPTAGVNGEGAATIDQKKNKEAAKAAEDDAAYAIIFGGAEVEAGKDIEVMASDVLVAELLAGSVAGGGLAGIGVGVTVAVLSSKVSAKVLADAILSAGGTVTVSASSGSQARKLSESELVAEDRDSGEDQRETANRMIADNDIADTSDDATATIRLISLTIAGGGTVGVGVACAVLVTYTEVEAIMDGIVKQGSVNVLSSMDYGDVTAAVLAVAGGGVGGIAASVGFVYYRGTADCGIGENARIGTEKAAKSVTVSSTGDVCARVGAAAAAGGGVVGAAAGVALVFNRSVVNNYIAAGALVNAKDGSVSVTSDYASASKALIISLAISGSVSVGATVSVVSNNLDVSNFIGSVGNTGKSVTLVAKTVDVKAVSSGELEVLGIGVAGGIAGINGVVSVCFNNVSAKSFINHSHINNGEKVRTDAVRIDAKLNGDAKSTSVAVAGGLVGGGASVIIAEVRAKSLSELDISDCNVLVKNLTIGGSPCNSEVEVMEVNVAGGLGAMTINFGLAINRAAFLSRLTGSTGTLDASSVTMEMKGNAYTNVFLASATFGGMAAGVNVGIALLRATQEAVVDGSADMTIGSLKVSSTQNLEAPKGSGSAELGKRKYDGKEYDLGKVDYVQDRMSQVYLYGVQFAGIGAAIDVGIAISDATCRAKVAPDRLSLSDELKVSASGYTNAKTVVQALGASAIGGASMVGFAYANGTIESLVSTNGEMKAPKGVSVKTLYESDVETVVSPSMGGVLGNLAVNVAIAKVKTLARALISGSGVIDATGADANISTEGYARSFARVAATVLSANVFSVGVSVVKSALEARQLAQIEGVNLKGRNLTIRSDYNVKSAGGSNVPGIIEELGSHAMVGASLAAASGISVKVNVAYANSDSTVRSWITGGSLELTGDADISTYAGSYAEAEVEAPVLEVTGYGCSCSFVFANARGTYMSGVDTGSGTDAVITGKNMKVFTGCNTGADAITGSFGGSFGLVSVKVNEARANVKSSAEAYVRSNGTVDLSGSLSVKTVGSGEAYTRVRQPIVEITGVSVAVNDLESRLNAYQKALLDIGGTMRVKGDIAVTSKLDNAVADAEVGTKKGVSISFAKGGSNTAFAYAMANNEAAILGKNGKIFAHSVEVSADTKTRASAVALKPVSIAAAEVEVNYAEAHTSDVTEAHIGSERSYDAIEINAEGGVKVSATGETSAYTELASGGSYSLVGVGVGDAVAYVGSGANHRQTVRAYVGRAVSLTAKGNISVTALNRASVKARMTKGYSVSAIAVNSNNVKTESYLLTEAFVGSNSTVESTTGDVTVSAEDSVTADALVNGSGTGIVLSADKKAAKNLIDSQVNAVVDTNATVIGYNNVTITSASNVNVTSLTEANSSGLFASGRLTSTVDVLRKVRTRILGGSVVKARYKTLTVKSEAGSKDKISNKAKGSAKGLTGIGGANVKTNLESDVETDVEAAQLYADFGTMNVESIVAAANVSTEGKYEAGGLVASPKADVASNWEDSHVTNPRFTSKVLIKSNALLRANYTNVAAKLGKLKIVTESKAKAGGAGGSVKAAADARINITNSVEVTNSDLQAYTKLQVWADGDPTNSGTNLKAKGDATLHALGGKVHGEAILRGESKANVYFKNTEFRAFSVSVWANKYAGSNSVKADRTGYSPFTKRDRTQKNEFKMSADVKMENDCSFVISGGALGTRAEADVQGIVHYTGSASAITGSNDSTNHILTINGKLTTKGAGSISVPGVDLSNMTVIDSAEYSILFENYYEGTILLPAMDLSLSRKEHGTPTIFCAAGKHSTYTTAEEAVIDIHSFNGGNVQFNNIICNENGTTNVVWYGESGDLYSTEISSGTPGEVSISPIWTERLNVVNVRNVGKSSNTYDRGDEREVSAPVAQNTYFKVMMGGEAVINITGTGNIYLQPVMTRFVRSSPLAPLPTYVENSVNLKSIETDGLVDILMGAGVGVSYMPGAGGVVLSDTYNTAVYVSATKSGTVTLTPAQLRRYLVGTDEDGTKEYQLPDGNSLLLDANGQFLSYGTETRFPRTKEGYYILDTQLDTEGNEYYVYLKSDGTIGMDPGYTGSFTVYLDYDEATGGFVVDGIKEIVSVDIERFIKDDPEVAASLGKYVAVGVYGDENGAYPFAEITGDALAEVLASSDVQNALRNGAFGNYYEFGKVSPLIHVYSLNNKQGEDEGFNDVFMILYGDVEYLGMFLKNSSNQVVAVKGQRSVKDPEDSDIPRDISKSGTEVLKYSWDEKIEGDSEETSETIHYDGWIIRRAVTGYKNSEGKFISEEEAAEAALKLQHIDIVDTFEEFYRLATGSTNYLRYKDGDREALFGLGVETVEAEDGSSRIVSGSVTISPIAVEVPPVTDVQEDGSEVVVEEGYTAYYPVFFQLKKNLKTNDFAVSSSLRMSADGKTLTEKLEGVTRVYRPTANYFSYSNTETDEETGISSTTGFEFNNGTVKLSNCALQYELITPDVAFTADGSYFYFDGEDWVKADYNSGTGTVSYKGRNLIARRSAKIGGEDGTIFTTYDESGVAQFEVSMVDDKVVATRDLVSNRPKTFAAGVMLYKDGSKTYDYGAGHYVVGKIVTGKHPNEDVVNSDIFLRFDNSYVSLTGTNEATGGYSLISDGDIYYYFTEEGIHDIGEEGALFNVRPNPEKDGSIFYKNWDGSLKTYYKDSQYQYVDNKDGFVFSDGTIFDSNAHYVLINTKGNISANDLVIMEGAYLSLAATEKGAEIILTGITEVGKDVPEIVADTYLQLSADGNVRIEKMIVRPNSTADINAYNGGLYGDTLYVDGGRSARTPDYGSALIANVRGDIRLFQKDPEGRDMPIVALNGAVIRLKSTEGGFFGSYGDTAGECVENREQDHRLLPITDSSVEISVLLALILSEVNVQHGSVVLESVGDSVYFDLITAASNVTVAANKDIDVLHNMVDGKLNHATIRFVDKAYEGETYDGETIHGADDSMVDKTSTLTLRAGGNIGRPDRWLYIDVPATLTPVIQFATNFYVDAQALNALDWDLYKYWVSSGYGVDKLNLGFEDIVTGTGVDYLSYSDLEDFRSFLNVSDNSALAAWIMQRSDDVNGYVNSFLRYGDVDKALRHLLAKEQGQEITREELTTLISLLGSTAAELSAYLTEQLSAEELRRKEAKEPELTDAEAYELVENEILRLTRSGEISEADAQALLTLMLDADTVAMDELHGLTDLINYLFKKSSYYSEDLQQLIDQALAWAQNSGKRAEEDKKASDEALAKAEAALSDNLTLQADMLKALEEAIRQSMALSSKVKIKETSILPTEADYSALYERMIADILSFVPGEESELALRQELNDALLTLSEGFKDYKPQNAVKNSVETLAQLANAYAESARSGNDSFLLLNELFAANRVITQRYAEVNDSYQSEMSSAQIARELDELLKEQGSWEQALAALEQAGSDLTAARLALLEAAEQGEGLEQARQKVLTAAAAYNEAVETVQQLYTRVYTLANTHYDQPTRPFSLKLGELYGDAYLYNSGDISVEMSPAYAYRDSIYSSVLKRAKAGEITVDFENRTSDLSIANIRSEHGDVSVVNKGGSIRGADLGKVNEGVDWFYRNDGLTYGYDPDFGWFVTDSQGVKQPFDPFAALNDGVNYRYDADASKWYKADGQGGWTEFAPTPELISATVADWFDTDPNSGFAGTDSVSRFFTKAHVFADELTLSAYGSVGSKDAPMLTEVKVSAPKKVWTPSLDMDPLRVGVNVRFEDLHRSIYDAATGFAPVREAVAEKVKAVCVLDPQRLMPFVLSGDEAMMAKLNGALAGAAVEAVDNYGIDDVQLKEITFTDETGKEFRTWSLEVSVRSDWLRVNDTEAAAPVHLCAETGDVYVRELNGSVKGGSITAGGDVFYEVPGSVTTADAPMDVQVGGEMNLNVGEGSIYFNTTDDLKLNCNAPDSHYEIETVAKTGTHRGSVEVNDLNPDTEVLTGFIHAMGDVGIHTAGDIGTKEQPFEFSNTTDNGDYGVLSFTGRNVYLNGQRADGQPNNVALDESVAEGELVLHNSGDVVNRSDSKYKDLMDALLEAQEENNRAQAALDEAEALRSALSNGHLEELMEQTETAIAEAQKKLDEKTLNVQEKEALVKEADEAWKAAQADYARKLKDKTVTEADMEALCRLEEAAAEAKSELNSAKAEQSEATGELNAARSELAALQKQWDSMEDYYQRCLDAAQQLIDEAESELAKAEKQQTAAQTAYDKAVAAGKSEAIAKAAEKLQAANEAVLAAQEAVQTAQDNYDHLKDDELAALRGYAEKQVAEAEEEAAQAAETLKDMKALIKAQEQLNDASVRAAKAAEAQDGSEEAALKARIAENIQKAALYVESATKLVLNSEDATESKKKLADTALQEAKQALSVMELADSFLNEFDEAFARQTGVDENSEELDKLKAVAAQQQLALALLEGVDSLASAQNADEEAQAETLLHAGKDLLNAAEDAYVQQQKLLEREQELQAAEEELTAAEDAWQTLSEKYPTEEDTLKAAQKDAALRSAYRRMLDAQAAVPVAEEALREQQEALDAANALKAQKTAIAEAALIADEALRAKDASDEALAAAKAEEKRAEDGLSAAKTTKTAADKDVQDRITALSGRIAARKDANLLDSKSVLDVLGDPDALAELSHEDVEQYAEQLYERFTEEAKAATTKEEVAEELQALADAAKAAATAADKEQEAQRTLKAEQDRRKAAEAALSEAETAQTNAKQQQTRTIAENGGLSKDASATGAEAAPVTDESRREKRDTAEKPNLRVEGNAEIVSGGSFGEADNTLSVEVGGKLDLTSGGEIGLNSFKELQLEKAAGQGDVTVTVNESITDVSEGEEPLISGEKLVLNAIPASDGEDGEHNVGGDKPVKISATGLGGNADNFAVENVNEGNTELANLNATHKADLSFNGSVSQEDGAVLRAEELKLKAKGQIGEAGDETEPKAVMTDGIVTPVGIEPREGAVVVDAKKLELSGKSANIHSLAPSTDVTISAPEELLFSASGNVLPESSRLNTRKAELAALGNVGTPLGGFTVPGSFTALSYYGFTNVRGEGGQVLANEDMIVYGIFPDKAELLSGALTGAELGNDAKLLQKAMESALRSLRFRVALPEGGTADGVFLLLVQVDGRQDGETVYALVDRNGETLLLRGFVLMGYAVFALDRADSDGDTAVVVLDEKGPAALGLSEENVRFALDFDAGYAAIIQRGLAQLKD